MLRELEMPLMPVLADIERAGILIDGPALAARSRQIEQELAGYTARIYELAGEEFNINSPPQLGRIPVREAGSAVREANGQDALVFDSRRGARRTGAHARTAAPRPGMAGVAQVEEHMHRRAAGHGRLEDWPSAYELQPGGRGNRTIEQLDPNLQNIPIRTELGREIRRAFVAAPGHVLISADYSQIELRVLAHMAGEQALIDAFRAGEDIHENGQKLFGVNNAMDKHQLRSLSKMVNYAVLYGKTPFTLAKDINVTQEAAQEFITRTHRLSKVRAFIDSILEEGRTTGVVRTMFGRRRLVPNLISRNFQMRSQAERETVNMPIRAPPPTF